MYDDITTMYLFSQSVYILGKFCHFSPVFRLFINIVVKPTIRKRYRKYRLERRCPTIKFMCSYCRHHLLSKGVAVKTMPATVYGKYGKKGLFAFYVLWIFCCFVLPRMFHDEPSEGVLDQMAVGLLRTIQVVPAGVWIGFGAVTLAVMAGMTVKFGMEQMVK